MTRVVTSCDIRCRVEYDNLNLVMTDDAVEITVFNRGITLFTPDDKKVRRIHRVLCKLDESGRR